jgi:hypothetical protein
MYEFLSLKRPVWNPNTALPPILLAFVSREEWGYTDRKTGVNINTNTIEGFYSVFKRGMKASINIAMRSIFTVIWQNSIFVIRTASHLALTIAPAPTVRCRASKARD